MRTAAAEYRRVAEAATRIAVLLEEHGEGMVLVGRYGELVVALQKVMIESMNGLQAWLERLAREHREGAS